MKPGDYIIARRTRPGLVVTVEGFVREVREKGNPIVMLCNAEQPTMPYGIPLDGTYTIWKAEK